MSMNVIELFPNAAKAPVIVPVYTIQWMTESGQFMSKSSSDVAGIRRQLESCRQRKLHAAVRQDGAWVGGVVNYTHKGGHSVWRAAFLDDVWGDF